MHVAIVGGGISGLYAACRLHDSSALHGIDHIDIFEKSGRVGGKVRSKKDGGILEAGAWRVSHDHALMIHLLGSTSRFLYPKTSHIHIPETKTDPEISVLASRIDSFGIKDAFNMDILSGYVDSDLMPSDGHQRHKGEFFGLSEGYHTAIEILNAKISSLPLITLHTGCTVQDVTYTSSGVSAAIAPTIGSGAQVMHFDVLIFACSPDQASRCSMSSLQKSLRPLCAAIHPLPLCRIYISTKPSHTGSDTIDVRSMSYRMIDTGGIWKVFSYTSGKLALAHRDLYNRHLQGDNRYNMFFWPNGTHMWNTFWNFNRKRMSSYATKVSNRVYIVGEALSDLQGWCEGALRSVMHLMTVFSKPPDTKEDQGREDHMKEYKRQYETDHKGSIIVFYRNRCLDISKWKDRHPGGPVFIQNIIEGDTGHDITEQFDKAHLNDYAYGQLLALQVGFLG
jgi:hypothetical protein